MTKCGYIIFKISGFDEIIKIASDREISEAEKLVEMNSLLGKKTFVVLVFQRRL